MILLSLLASFAIAIFIFAFDASHKIKRAQRKLSDACPDGGMRRDVVPILGRVRVLISVNKTGKSVEEDIEFSPDVTKRETWKR